MGVISAAASASNMLPYAGNSTICVMLSEEYIESICNLYKGSGGTTLASLFCESPTTAIRIQTKSKTQSNLEITVEEVCSTFSLTKEEFTKICRIRSRKTLYNWINGEASPRKSAMHRLFDLLVVARAWQHYGFRCSREQLYQLMVGEQNIFEMLSQPKIDKELILFAGSRLNTILSPKRTLKSPFA